MESSRPILRVVDPAFGCSFQDAGRIGWRRFGVPQGGWMDAHSAACANRLLGNPPGATVLELLLQGARLEVLDHFWLALCGADAQANIPSWRTCKVSPGEVIRFAGSRSGLWIYLAVEGGFDAVQFFGSSSYYARGPIGTAIAAGAILRQCVHPAAAIPTTPAGRLAHWDDQRTFDRFPPLSVWPGPQWKSFSVAHRGDFFSAEWVVSASSDRVGYRLEGPQLKPSPPEIVSEPARVGSIQVPENGQPIVLMPDGPSVGGYPKLGLVEPASLSWLAQARPGQKIRFELRT